MGLNAEIVYSILKKYINKTLAGGGAIKGKNCVIESIQDSEMGHSVFLNGHLTMGL